MISIVFLEMGDSFFVKLFFCANKKGGQCYDFATSNQNINGKSDILEMDAKTTLGTHFGIL